MVGLADFWFYLCFVGWLVYTVCYLGFLWPEEGPFRKSSILGFWLFWVFHFWYETSIGAKTCISVRHA